VSRVFIIWLSCLHFFGGKGSFIGDYIWIGPVT
jgi:hypothetical protein